MATTLLTAQSGTFVLHSSLVGNLFNECANFTF